MIVVRVCVSWKIGSCYRHPTKIVLNSFRGEVRSANERIHALWFSILNAFKVVASCTLGPQILKSYDVSCTRQKGKLVLVISWQKLKNACLISSYTCNIDGWERKMRISNVAISTHFFFKENRPTVPFKFLWFLFTTITDNYYWYTDFYWKRFE